MKPLKLPKLESEMVGAEIWMQDSELQFLGASTRILCPSIWKEIEPAWAAGVAISSAARTRSFFM